MITNKKGESLSELPYAAFQEVVLTPDHPPNNATFHPVFSNIP